MALETKPLMPNPSCSASTGSSAATTLVPNTASRLSRTDGFPCVLTTVVRADLATCTSPRTVHTDDPAETKAFSSVNTTIALRTEEAENLIRCQDLDRCANESVCLEEMCKLHELFLDAPLERFVPHGQCLEQFLHCHRRAYRSGYWLLPYKHHLLCSRGHQQRLGWCSKAFKTSPTGCCK